ncbi:STAS/SEC14 domain-containing protein [Krasilnikovia sp. MM14-A1259]|uniref:STAS/SEC14 domain-containing protein n=1 Tax=Krasilnikovia sp. MM14-A1259 TaxID=3373539 RepID=UPI00380B2858
MLEALEDLPDGVIGFRAVGELHASDYRDVLAPAIAGVLAAGGEVRLVLVFEQFGGMSGGAAWQDLKVGMEHLTKWKRIALVTDIDWMIHLVSLFGWMSPGDVRRFPLAERNQATTWAAG